MIRLPKLICINDLTSVHKVHVSHVINKKLGLKSVKNYNDPSTVCLPEIYSTLLPQDQEQSIHLYNSTTSPTVLQR